MKQLIEHIISNIFFHIVHINGLCYCISIILIVYSDTKLKKRTSESLDLCMYESSLIPHYFIECGLMRVSQDSSWFVGKCSVTLASVYGSAESSEF